MRTFILKCIEKLLEYIPTYKNYTVTRTYRYIDGTSQIHYWLNNKKLVFIGKEEDFPPTFTPKFTVPIKKAYIDDVDSTAWVKSCAGLNNELPDPMYLKYNVVWKFYIEISNIFKYSVNRILIPSKNVKLELEDFLNKKTLILKD